ncbi:ABC transporter substrate-binding protein [Methylicorpusculum sp.]|uniref:ABC transporter substrate-binding protein n=1 Tax=Methylicorpusculum sp. TaxID=2713644 RepID=UPI00271E52FA|nr:ABC transporter substrate-binding protein [Methylicorpusculum sp.]MDO8845457.1 ABC transporter substrate-binding protein [Methylicorpusculum sp.]
MAYSFILRVLFLYLCWVGLAGAANEKEIKIAYFSQDLAPPQSLSNLDPFIKDKGFPGAQLGVADNNTTGRFTGQVYAIDEIAVPVQGDTYQLFKDKVLNKYAFVISNLPAAELEKISELAKPDQMLIFDANTSDDALRAKCLPQVLFILPSRAMRADALAQYMMKKRWSKWFLVVGPAKEDELYAAAIKRSAKRFGIKITAEKKWEHTFDARKTEQSDIPTFTQAGDYDVLIVADEQGAFGEYLDYRTWIPRPVIGTQGLIATAWHKTHEQWGAIQMQNRFKDKIGRWMEEADYGAYIAVRAIGEAATRTGSVNLADIKAYMLSKDFALQGYKGKPLSFRVWDGQMRQPVLLAAPRSLVAVAPIEGFLHPKTELDTLGFDQPESLCK